MPHSDVADARRLFPGASRVTYLDLGGRGLLSTPVQQAIERHVRDGVEGCIDKDFLFEQTEAARTGFAQLINASPDEVTFTKNTSEGLNMVARAIEWQPGDNVILCPELEHPNNVYAWLNLQRHGVEVRVVPNVQGRMPVDAMIRAIDARTRLLTASAVTFSPGFRTDVETLGRACRERGVIFLVDAAQSAGIVHTDVQQAPIDALATSTQKGLLGLYGMGYLYVRRELAETLVPAGLARFGVELDAANAHESDLGGGWHLRPGALRFDLGNYNYAGVYAANASLRLLLDIGTPAIERHATGLARTLAAGLAELGLPVVGASSDPDRAHIVTLGVYEAGAPAYGGDASLHGLYAHLTAHDVKLSMRRGLLRFAFHVYNDASDVQRVLSLAADWVRAPR